MGSRTEKDYDSATPALQQQMNLARRACWTHGALWPIEPSSRTVPTLSPYPNSSPRQCSALSTNGAIASQAANPMKLNRSEDEEQRSRRPRRRQTMATSMHLRVLLLCGICMWFACCEARPNVSASSSTVSSSASSATTSSAGPTDAVTQLNVSALN